METLPRIPVKTAHQAVHDAIRNDLGVTEPIKINGVPQPGMRLTDNRIYDKDKAATMAHAMKPAIDGVLDTLDSAVSDKPPDGLATLKITTPDGTILRGFNTDPRNEVITEQGQKWTTKQLLAQVAMGNQAADRVGKQWDAQEARAAQLEQDAQDIRDQR